MTVVTLTAILGPIRPAEPATFGAIRAAAPDVMVGTRGPMLRLGERMMLCAWTAEAPRDAPTNTPKNTRSNTRTRTGGTAAASSVRTAARRPTLRLASRWSTMGPPRTHNDRRGFFSLRFTARPLQG